MDVQHFSIPLSQFDATQLPAGAREPGTPAFSDAVLLYFVKKYATSGLSAVVTVDDEIRVTTFPNTYSDPMDVALDLLNQGDIKKAIPILESLARERPRNSEVLYNLGIAHSELGEFDQAIMRLKQLVKIDPTHANGLVGLGVAYQRLGNAALAEQFLTRAVEVEPSNPYAQRNLGSVLGGGGKLPAAIAHLRKAHELAPNDPAATFGLGRSLVDLGDDDGVDEGYKLLKEVIARFPGTKFDELAREACTAVAAKSMRARVGGGLRPDVVMYIVSAMDVFAKQGDAKRREIAFEIAMLGTKGLDINDPMPKYQLKSLPGNFSGLNLSAIMYAAFRQMEPSLNTGIDYSKEYDAAAALRGAGSS